MAGASRCRRCRIHRDAGACALKPWPPGGTQLARGECAPRFNRRHAMDSARPRAAEEERCKDTLPSTLRPDALEAVHGGQQVNCPDADGYVPEFLGRFGGTWYGQTPVVSRFPCQRAIFYNAD